MGSRRIGITMRVDNAVGYNEPRDCLAQDWWDYLQFISPDIHWMALPNIGNNIQNLPHGMVVQGCDHCSIIILGAQLGIQMCIIHDGIAMRASGAGF